MKISVVIVSYNSKKDLSILLPSIFQNQTNDLEIILVDNHSQDNTVSWLKKNYPQVKLIENQKNLGFGAANNQGIKAAKNDLVFLLNPDTVLLKDTLEQVKNWFKNHPDCSIMGLQMLNADGTIQPSGGHFPNLLNLFFWALFLDDLPIFRRLVKPYQETRKSFFKRQRQVDWLMGAGLVFKKPVFKTLNGFDEKIFLYGEEVELLYRAFKNGYKAWLSPQAKLVHFGYGKSLKKSAVLGEFKGLKYFFKKHRPKWQLFFLSLILKMSAQLRILIFGKILKRQNYKRIYEEAYSLA